ANLEPSQVGYINAHGTGTRLNDQVEGEAIARVFGPDVLVSSTKGLTGHLLGAAGATEAALTIEALLRGVLPPNVGLHARDPSVPVRFVERSVSSTVRRAASNSFAFGGCNATVIVGEAESRAVPDAPPRSVHVVGAAFWAPGAPSVEAWLEGRDVPSAVEP